MDALLIDRTRAGTDNALRLAAIYPYLGVDHWYALARAAGLVAMGLAWLSVLLGLEAGRRRQGGRGVPAWLNDAHRQAGVVVVVLVAAHAALPFLSAFAPYEGWPTATVPFGQPRSWGPGPTFWETFGIVAFYVLVATGPSWYLMRGRPRAWQVIHRIGAVGYGLAVAHALLLGSDLVVAGPLRVMVVAAQVPVAALLSLTLWNRTRPVLAGMAGAGAAGLVVLCVLMGSGVTASGVRL